jgi:hypothetical protein
MSTNAPSTKPKSPWPRVMTSTLLILVLGYALILLAVFLFQRRLIYFPTKLSPQSAEQAAAQTGFLPWRMESGRIIGWKLPAGSAPAGNVLIAHGNAGCALDRSYLATPIHDAAALDVYILEYPGYGARGGSPDKESLFAAADDALEKLPANLPVYVVSESLGAGVAAHLAQKYPARVAGIALFAPYDRLASVAQSHMPYFLPSLLLRDRFAPADDLKNYRGPIKFVIAGADEIIPPQFGQRLYDGYAGPKTLQIIPDARHNDIPAQSPAWWREVLSFWRQPPGPQPAAPAPPLPQRS